MQGGGGDPRAIVTQRGLGIISVRLKENLLLADIFEKVDSHLILTPHYLEFVD